MNLPGEVSSSFSSILASMKSKCSHKTFDFLPGIVLSASVTYRVNFLTNFEMVQRYTVTPGWQARDSGHFDQRIFKPIWRPAGEKEILNKLCKNLAFL